MAATLRRWGHRALALTTAAPAVSVQGPGKVVDHAVRNRLSIFDLRGTLLTAGASVAAATVGTLVGGPIVGGAAGGCAGGAVGESVTGGSLSDSLKSCAAWAVVGAIGGVVLTVLPAA
ncbi:hypothetical protein GCM10009612_27140 [Streptomyces beijiangensis]